MPPSLDGHVNGRYFRMTPPSLLQGGDNITLASGVLIVKMMYTALLFTAAAGRDV